MDTPRLIDINELSQRLSVPKGSIYNMVYQHRIPFLKIGRSLRFDVDAIEQYLKRHAEPERK
jgi:excisionase family DNA binding protein